MAQPKVLVTGMSGLIGGAVRQRLEGRYALSALNRSEVPGVPCHRADIGDLEAILPAFTGIDTVVHLAAFVGGFDDWEPVLKHNVIGTYNVFEAARRAGVKRIVYASSGATISGWEHEMPYQALVAGDYDEVPASWPMITHETPVRPSGLYGCSKIWGEALARHFTDTADLSILCVRIGAVNRADRPQPTRGFSVWCSQRDIAQMIERCIQAPPSLKYEVVFALSKNRWGYRDLEHARQAVGFVPEDEAEAHR